MISVTYFRNNHLANVTTTPNFRLSFAVYRASLSTLRRSVLRVGVTSPDYSTLRELGATGTKEDPDTGSCAKPDDAVH